MRQEFSARLRGAGLVAGTVALLAASVFGLARPRLAYAAAPPAARPGASTAQQAAGAYWAARDAGVTSATLAQARAQAARLPKATHLPPSNYWGPRRATPATVGIPSGPWHPLGPSLTDASHLTWGANQPDPPVTGTVLAVTVDPANASIIYLGTDGGGIWKTTNGGQSWTQLSETASPTIGAIAIDPTNPNIIYAGTGRQLFDTYDNALKVPVGGVGILKSTDGGTTWTLYGQPTLGSYHAAVNQMVINPYNTQQVFVAANVGFWRSDDGGQTYTAYESGIGSCYEPCGLSALAMSADTNPVTLYAVSGAGLFRSTNDGTSWAQESIFVSANRIYNAALAVAPSAPNVVYLIMTDENGDVYDPHYQPFETYRGGFYSTDHGATWSTMTSLNLDVSRLTGQPSGDGDINLALAVDPLNDDTLYAGGADLGMTTDARGSTGNWRNISDVAGYDNSGIAQGAHAITFAPCASAPCTAYFGNDGGIYSSNTLSAANAQDVTYTDLNTAGLDIGTMLGGDAGPNFADAPLALAGTTGGGTALYNGSTTWSAVAPGDSSNTAIDWTNPNIQYTESDFGQLYKTTDGWAHATALPSTTVTGYPYYTAFTLDRANDQHLVVVNGSVWESVNGGASWYSEDITQSGGNYYSAVAVAPANSHVIYVGYSDGEVDRTVRGDSGQAAKFVPIGTVSLYEPVQSIAIDPTDTTGETAYAAAYTTLAMTTNAGYSWTNIATALPQIPIHSVVTYYSGTTPVVVAADDIGVYYTTNAGATWYQLTTLPTNAPITQLALDGNDTTLVAFTRGNGAYSLDIPEAAGGTGDTPGIYRPSTTTFYLRNGLTTGPANESVTLPGADANSLPLAGTWNGTGLDAVGYYNSATATFYLGSPLGSGTPSIAYTIPFGSPGDLPVVGDWTGQGRDGIGVFHPATGTFLLRNSLSAGPPDFTISFGASGDLPVVGDWSGQGYDTVGVYRPSSALFLLSNTRCGVCAATANYIVAFGKPGDVPMVGDWTRSGRTGLGVFRPTNGIVYLKNDATHSGYADFFLVYGIANDRPLAGHWV